MTSLSDKYGHYWANRYNEHIGIEIETEFTTIPNIETRELPLGWRRKSDGSLRNAGLEFYLRCPINYVSVPEMVIKLGTHLQEQGFVLAKTDRAGVHIHLNCQNKEMEEIKNIIFIYSVVEELLLEYCGDNRVGNVFCLRQQDAASIFQRLFTLFETDDFIAISGTTIRYSALNLSAILKFGTLEFRSLETPDSFEKWRQIGDWVSIIKRIEDAGRQYSPRAVVEMLPRLGPRQWLKEIFKEQTKLLPTVGVSRMLTQGLWRVQPLAYIEPGQQRRLAGVRMDALAGGVEEEDEE